jgi:predicted amidohydrolase
VTSRGETVAGDRSAPADSVTVALCQLAPAMGEVEANRDRILAAVRAAKEDGADVVVLPELATSGYVFEDEAEARGLAEPADGPTTRALHDLAASLDVTVVVGLPELQGDHLYNSAVVVDRTGLRATYRKVHLWGREPQVFTAGDDPAPVVDMGWGRLSVLVCYDLEFPEWVRRTALAGADLVCAPANWPDEGRPEGERPLDMVNVLAAAAANRIFIAACDRVGVERGTRWVAGSVLAGPDGYPLAAADLTQREQRLLASCDLRQARDKTLGAHNDRFADRRTDLYGVET